MFSSVSPHSILLLSEWASRHWANIALFYDFLLYWRFFLFFFLFTSINSMICFVFLMIKMNDSTRTFIILTSRLSLSRLDGLKKDEGRTRSCRKSIYLKHMWLFSFYIPNLQLLTSTSDLKLLRLYQIFLSLNLVLICSNKI